ncbi:MAG: hypothetical protein AAGU75_11760 [Bacillota bacterium]
MLQTPLGNIKLYLDGNPIEYTFTKAPENPRLYPDVNGAFLLKYSFQADGKNHALRCVVDNSAIVSSLETGENFVAVSIHSSVIKMTLGIQGDFGCQRHCMFDFGGQFLRNGIEIQINSKTKSQDFTFGISWISPYTQENELQTWFAADPSI